MDNTRGVWCASECAHLVGEELPGFAVLCEPEIDGPQRRVRAAVLEQEILRLHIAHDDAAAVALRHGAQDVAHDARRVCMPEKGLAVQDSSVSDPTNGYGL